MAIGFITLFMQLLKIAVMDAKTKKITNKDNFRLFLIAIFLLLLEGKSGKEIVERILACVITFFMLFIFSLFVKGVGGGDCKLLANVTLLLGISGLCYVLLLASIFSIMYARGRYQRNYRKVWVPFGPGICLSIIILLIWKGL